MTRDCEPELISVVAPCYNEMNCIESFINELVAELDNLEGIGKYELVIVDDGSNDGSDSILDQMATVYPGKMKVIHLSRNFGHAQAVSAGLKHISGDIVILMDSDLQDDPSCFSSYISKWRDGYDVVYSKRTSRLETAPMRFLFWLFYRVLILMSDVHIPADAGNYSLMDRRVVDHLMSLPEQKQYLPGLRAWVGFKQIGISVPRRRRYDNKVKTRLMGKWKLGLSAIIGFSFLPLVIFRFLGAIAIVASLVLTAYTLYHKFITGLAVTTWASIIISTTFFGGLNLVGIGIVGEYISRIFNEVRGRPMYIIDRIVGINETHHNDLDKK